MGKLMIDFVSSTNTAGKVSVINLLGEVVSVEHRHFSSGNNMFSLPTDTWASGIYFVRLLTSENHHYWTKIAVY